jgi:hypothetical protein
VGRAPPPVPGPEAWVGSSAGMIELPGNLVGAASLLAEISPRSLELYR